MRFRHAYTCTQRRHDNAVRCGTCARRNVTEQARELAQESYGRKLRPGKLRQQSLAVQLLSAFFRLIRLRLNFTVVVPQA